MDHLKDRICEGIVARKLCHRSDGHIIPYRCNISASIDTFPDLLDIQEETQRKLRRRNYKNNRKDQEVSVLECVYTVHIADILANCSHYHFSYHTHQIEESNRSRLCHC